jgi:hypothetical protein
MGDYFWRYFIVIEKIGEIGDIGKYIDCLVIKR